MIKIWIANGSSFTISMIDDIEWWFRVLLLLITLGYTAWKWRDDYKKSKKANDLFKLNKNGHENS